MDTGELIKFLVLIRDISWNKDVHELCEKKIDELVVIGLEENEEHCEWCDSVNDVKYVGVDGKGGYLCKNCRKNVEQE